MLGRDRDPGDVDRGVTPDPYDDREVDRTTTPPMAEATPAPAYRASATPVYNEGYDEPGIVSARGGVALGAVLTGVLVAFGSMMLLTALAAGIIAALDLTRGDVTGNVTEISIGAAAVLVIAQLLSYMWGGYTAGRMARGAGMLNGMLVPVTAIVIGGIVAAIVAAMGADANLNLPFTNQTISIDEGTATTIGIGTGIGMLLAMFIGATVGGHLGARWHHKLEDREIAGTYRAA
ncbi:MAG TPA: hypothetical protein VM600_03430 [Actinomycetota bacterium]|nr:hypothetical protein [Actinomycetota bacterium]